MHHFLQILRDINLLRELNKHVKKINKILNKINKDLWKHKNIK